MGCVSEDVSFRRCWKWAISNLDPPRLLMRHGSPSFHLSMCRTRWRKHAHPHTRFCSHQVNGRWKRDLPQPRRNLGSILFQRDGREAKFPNIPASIAQRTRRCLQSTKILLVSPWILESVCTSRAENCTTRHLTSNVPKTGRAKTLPEFKPGGWDRDCHRK